jgi:hypothetical protein
MFDWITDVLEWLKELLLWLPRKLWELLLDGLASVLELIPVPEFLQGGPVLGFVPPEVAFFAHAFLLEEGVTIVIGAYMFRFILRRIPVIG